MKAPADDMERRRWRWLALARFVLASIVVLFHIQRRLRIGEGTWWTELDGRVAVIAFLLISGYSISASLTQRAEGFYRRRLLRVYPLLIGALAFTQLLTWLSPKVYASGGIPVMIGNLVAPPGHLCLVPTLNLPLWSLGCEIVFYALAPLLFRAPGWMLVLLALISARAYMSPLVNEWLHGAPTLCFLWSWLLGFVLHARRTPALLVAAGLSACLLGWHPLVRYAKFSIVAQYIGTLFLLTVSWLPPLGLFADYLGAISFPLYLVHFPVIVYLADTLAVKDPGIFLAAVIVVTLFFHHLVDGPGRRLLDRLFPTSTKEA